MGQITFIEHDGTEHSVELEPGKSLMQIAMDNLVPGIDADCGGECACGTCHVVVEAKWMTKTGDIGDAERQMLDLNPEQSENSRLACQIATSEELADMVVHLPEFQM